MKNPLPLNWRRFPERYKLRGNHCETCDTSFFPGRQICPNCRRKGNLVEQDMPRDGTITSYTRVYSGPSGFKHETPYYMAIIDLGNGASILSQIVDTEPERVKIGAKAKKVFRKIMEPDKKGVISYGYKFRVVD